MLPLGAYGHNSAEALHTLIEAKKLAYADMARHVCDPAFHDVPVEAMLSKAYAAQRCRQIDPAHANPEVAPGTLPTHGGDTTYLSVVDRAGNMVSLIQSNFANFGSGARARRHGIRAAEPRRAVHDRSRRIPTRSRRASVRCTRSFPAFMKAQDRPARSCAFGIMGGWNQSQAHVQFISNIVDHGMNIQAALEAARFDEADVRRTRRDDGVARSGGGARRAWRDKGHEIDLQGEFLEHGRRRTERHARLRARR